MVVALGVVELDLQLDTAEEARGRVGEDESVAAGSEGLSPGQVRDDIGSLEPGKRADFAVWRTDSLELGGAEDVVAGFVLSLPHRVDRLYVGGVEVVRDGHLTRVDEEEIARVHRAQARRFAGG